MDTATTNGAVPANRLDRRKARTRQALVDAAVGLIADGRGERASILGLLRLHASNPERVTETSVDELTEACLRFLGLAAAQARRLARLRLPDARW